MEGLDEFRGDTRKTLLLAQSPPGGGGGSAGRAPVVLPGALVRNQDLRFHCHPVRVRVEQTDTPFTTAYESGRVLTMPIAHGEGQFVALADTLSELEATRRVIFRYVDAGGEASAKANPNGSANNISGICNEGRNVVGLMPHPERAVSELLSSEDGLGVFRSALAAGVASSDSGVQFKVRIRFF